MLPLWCVGGYDIVIIFCLVSNVYFNFIVQDSLYHNMDIGIVWHCALVSCTSSKSTGLVLGVRCSGVECHSELFLLCYIYYKPSCIQPANCDHLLQKLFFFCLVSNVYFNFIVQHSLYHNMDIGTM